MTLNGKCSCASDIIKLIKRIEDLERTNHLINHTLGCLIEGGKEQNRELQSLINILVYRGHLPDSMFNDLPEGGNEISLMKEKGSA